MTVVEVSRTLVFFGAGGGGIRSSSLVEVEDLVIWLDEVIGRPSSTIENPSNFWWHITMFINPLNLLICHQAKYLKEKKCYAQFYVQFMVCKGVFIYLLYFTIKSLV